MDETTAPEPPAPAPAGGSFIQAIARQMSQVRHTYPDLGELSVDYLFMCFLSEVTRLGRFTYGPITIETRVVEDLFERITPRLKPGEHWTAARQTPSYHKFYETLSAEVTRSGRRRVDDLHWLMAFMRTPEGLPGKVFGELGVSVEEVERFTREGAKPAEQKKSDTDGLERLYSPEEIADYLGVHVQTVRAWVRSGRLPARRILGQRSLRIRKSDLDAVLMPVVPGEPEPSGEES
jgi:excisionase family DNA binding protein